MSKNIFIVLMLFLSSCMQDKNADKSDLKYVPEPSEILKDFSSFWKYYSHHVKLYEDFIALDTSGKRICRGDFFKDLSSGDYIPLRKTSADTATYKLVKLKKSDDRNIFLYMNTYGNVLYKYFLMENKPLPKFDFVDLTGHLYNAKNTIGKVVVIKLWFIKCQACLEEMPYVNNIFEQYKNRNDIVFLSLAFDSPDSLKSFIRTTRFNYHIVANKESYMIHDLGIYSFPTHIIINKQGKVVRLVQSAKEMAFILNTEASK